MDNTTPALSSVTQYASPRFAVPSLSGTLGTASSLNRRLNRRIAAMTASGSSPRTRAAGSAPEALPQSPVRQQTARARTERGHWVETDAKQASADLTLPGTVTHMGILADDGLDVAVTKNVRSPAYGSLAARALAKTAQVPPPPPPGVPPNQFSASRVPPSPMGAASRRYAHRSAAGAMSGQLSVSGMPQPHILGASVLSQGPALPMPPSVGEGVASACCAHARLVAAASSTFESRHGRQQAAACGAVDVTQAALAAADAMDRLKSALARNSALTATQGAFKSVDGCPSGSPMWECPAADAMAVRDAQLRSNHSARTSFANQQQQQAATAVASGSNVGSGRNSGLITASSATPGKRVVVTDASVNAATDNDNGDGDGGGFVNPLEALATELPATASTIAITAMTHADPALSSSSSAAAAAASSGASASILEDSSWLNPGPVPCALPYACIPTSASVSSAGRYDSSHWTVAHAPSLHAPLVSPPPPDEDHTSRGDITPDPCFRGEGALAKTAAAGATGGGRSRGPQPPERALLVAASPRGICRAMLWCAATSPQGRLSGVKEIELGREGWSEWWMAGMMGKDDTAASAASASGAGVTTVSDAHGDGVLQPETFNPDCEEAISFPALAWLALGRGLAGYAPSSTPLRVDQLRPPRGWSGKESRGAWWRPRKGNCPELPGTGSGDDSLAMDLTLIDTQLLCATVNSSMGEILGCMALELEEARTAVRATLRDTSASSSVSSSALGVVTSARVTAAGAIAVIALLCGRHLLRFAPTGRRQTLEAANYVLDEVDKLIKTAPVSKAYLQRPDVEHSRLHYCPLSEASEASRRLLQHTAVLSDRIEARSGRAGRATSTPVPAPGEPRFDSWLRVPVRLLAEQWARADFALFQQVPVEELIEAGFDDPRYKHTADAVRACVDRFNAQSLWAATQIVTASTPRARAATFMRLLAVAVWLRRLRDFFGLSSILTGLRSTPIKRLAITLSQLPAEAVAQEKELSKTVSEALFFTRYFKALTATPDGAAATPYLAPHTQLLLLTAATMEGEYPRNWSLGHAYKARAMYEVAAPLAELREGAYTSAIDGDAGVQVQAVSALIEAALRPHTFYFDEDASSARARLLKMSNAVEPDLPPEPVAMEPQEQQWEEEYE